jgi:hypothetical protein
VGDMFKLNRTLVHVDLSFTKIRAQDSEAIREGLRVNHSVLGIHIQGNENLSIDTKGQVMERESVEVHPVVTRIRHDLQTGTLSAK